VPVCRRSKGSTRIKEEGGFREGGREGNIREEAERREGLSEGMQL
jgi:hypothetical protein